MSSKLKDIFKIIFLTMVIMVSLWYLIHQFATIEARLKQVVVKEIPSIKETLEENSKRSTMIKTAVSDLTHQLSSLEIQEDSVKKIREDLEHITQKIDEELVPGLAQLEQESGASTAEVKDLSQKIDILSKQYVKFLKLSEDKITVSIPPKWLDTLPSRKGTIFAIGISSKTPEIQKSQQRAVEQALSNMSMMLKRKTTNAVANTVRAAGKTPPATFEELSKQLRQQITEAINELLLDFRVESYWIDPAGFVYSLISLPIEDRIEGSRFGMLIETLKLTHLSITEAMQQDFKDNLQVELLK